MVWQLASDAATQSKRVRGESIEDRGQSFYNFVSEMTSYHFCCILFVRSESQGPAHTQRKRITQKCECKEAAIIRATLEAESHICLCYMFVKFVVSYMLARRRHTHCRCHFNFIRQDWHEIYKTEAYVIVRELLWSQVPDWGWGTPVV